MKTRILLLASFLVLTFSSSAQLMTFGFVKNCMNFGRSTVTDELKKKHFTLLDRNYQAASSPLLQGATFYSNQTDRTAGIGEIAVLSQINGLKQITEISFISGTKNSYGANFDELYRQLVNFFKNEKTFKSATYNTDINVLTGQNVYYYIYKNKDVPVIVISNYKLEEAYFAKK